jgi:hypothetical protein
MRANVSKARGSHKSAEAPAASIAIALCSSELRSVHETPSIAAPTLNHRTENWLGGVNNALRMSRMSWTKEGPMIPSQKGVADVCMSRAIEWMIVKGYVSLKDRLGVF